ncbi:hypothetical protein IV203_013252 [Nitzschia inconspicua]|uniref:Uncharacterized protein n=1 Tax=Nitzschia inconspicua TaxID=303405 RepID=A0A9K3Q7B7_9STRA|nr:hypothetical protein IV203_013252 [Nitzschia inconspicua]
MTDRRFNPLRQLIAGFCDPYSPHDDDEDTVDTTEDSPPMVHRTATTAKGSKSVEGHTLAGQAARRAVINGKLQVSTTAEDDSTVPPVPQQRPTRDTSELTIESTANEIPFRPDENGPEIQFSMKITRQRREHALQVFFASLIFVVGTVMVLHKLGYPSMADFHAPKNILASSWGTGWIQIFDKTVIDRSGFLTLQVSTKKKEPSQGVPPDVEEDEIPVDVAVSRSREEDSEQATETTDTHSPQQSSTNSIDSQPKHVHTDGGIKRNEDQTASEALSGEL